jgi:4-hydroxybenzoate polyprenyltransferase
MVVGEALLVFQPFPVLALRWGIALSVAIVFYDFSHKGQPHGPIIMGLCRALVYLVSAAGATGGDLAVLVPAMFMLSYVMVLTHIAKLAGRGDWIPWLIAGICLVDAIFIATAGGGPILATIAVAGFFATLALQRVVPGT